MGQTTDPDTTPAPDTIGEVRRAAGEGSDSAELKARAALERGAAKGESARVRAAHAGNRQHQG